MSDYIMLIFIPIVLYYLYSFWKTKLDIYLILGTVAWYGIFYSERFGLHQLLQQPFKLIVNFITVLLILQLFISYFKKIIQDYGKYKGNKK